MKIAAALHFVLLEGFAEYAACLLRMDLRHVRPLCSACEEVGFFQAWVGWADLAAYPTAKCVHTVPSSSRWAGLP